MVMIANKPIQKDLYRTMRSNRVKNSTLQAAFALGVTALSLSFANPVNAQVTQPAGVNSIPTPPVNRCTTSWHRWFTTNRNFSVTKTAVSPETHNFNRVITPNFLNPSAADLAYGWYTPRGGPSSTQLNIASTSEPTESFNATGEIFYGIATYEFEPNSTATIPLSDGASIFEGHVLSAFDSDGNQIGRFPTVSHLLSNIRYVASFNDSGPQKNQNNDLKKSASWSDSTSFNFQVPSDGKVFAHYIIIDEASSSGSAMKYCPEDISDAPASFGVARHNYDVDLLIGARKDVDVGVAGNATATGDDANDQDSGGTAINDEDGVASFPALSTGSTSYSIDVSVQNTSGAGATLYGWIDFDDSGTFDASEFTSIAVPATATTAKLDWAGLSGLVEGDTYARFRLTSDTLTATDASLRAADGEVEDHVVAIAAATDLVTVKTLTSGDNTPAEGDTVTFAITVTNDGPSDATNVSLTDDIPSALTATTNNGNVTGTGASTGGSYDDSNGLWSIGSLANGETATLTIEGEVNAGEGGNTITNTTSVAAADQIDPSTALDDLNEAVTVDLSILANDDDFTGTLVGTTGGATASVFINSDSLNGVAFADGLVIATIADDDGLTSVTIGADGTLTIPNGTTSGPYDVEYQICEAANATNCDRAIAKIIVAPVSDFMITKTNTPGVNGNVDQTDDTVTSGASTTYTLTVTNNGPDSVTGALVTDTPTAGLTCTGTNAVTITGDGIPTGSFTIADLTGAGISLGTLADGESAVLTYSCLVG